MKLYSLLVLAPLLGTALSNPIPTEATTTDNGIEGQIDADQGYTVGITMSWKFGEQATAESKKRDLTGIEQEADADKGYTVGVTLSFKSVEEADVKSEKRDIARTEEQADADKGYTVGVTLTFSSVEDGTLEKRDLTGVGPHGINISFGADGRPIVTTTRKRHEEDSDQSWAHWVPFTSETIQN